MFTLGIRVNLGLSRCDISKNLVPALCGVFRHAQESKKLRGRPGVRLYQLAKRREVGAVSGGWRKLDEVVGESFIAWERRDSQWDIRYCFIMLLLLHYRA